MSMKSRQQRPEGRLGDDQHAYATFQLLPGREEVISPTCRSFAQLMLWTLLQEALHRHSREPGARQWREPLILAAFRKIKIGVGWVEKDDCFIATPSPGWLGTLGTGPEESDPEET